MSRSERLTPAVVLVTGAAGLIGSHLVDALLSQGHTVIGLDDLSRGSRANLAAALEHECFEFVQMDVRSVRHMRADLIFHLASPASPAHYRERPDETVLTCVLGTQRIVELARQHAATIVFASTSEVYGDPEVHPQAETYVGRVDPTSERACYVEGKRCAETLLTDASRAGIDARIVRIFNTYGPRMAFDDGRVIASFIVQALRGQPVTVYGDGTQTRSFCYVDDLVAGLLKVAALPALDRPINLGNPREITIAALAERIAQVCHAERGVRRVPLPWEEPRRRQPDIGLARRLLDFEPSVDLDTGLERTIADFRARLGRRP